MEQYCHLQYRLKKVCGGSEESNGIKMGQREVLVKQGITLVLESADAHA